jgi:hypothetical protein
MDHGSGVWSENSHAQRVQGLGFAYSDMANTMIQGSYLSAFPILVQTGPGFGSKVLGYKPGQLVQGPEGMHITAIPIPFNPGHLGPMMQEIKQSVDALTGISPVGMAEGMPRPTTATEIEALIQAQSESKGAHAEFAAAFVERTFLMLYSLLRAHFPDIKRSFGASLPIEDPSQLRGYLPRIEASGKTASSSPMVQIAKLTQLLQFAQDPASGLSKEMDTGIPHAAIVKDGPELHELAVAVLAMIQNPAQAPPQAVAQMAMAALKGLEDDGQGQAHGRPGAGVLFPPGPRGDVGGAAPDEGGPEGAARFREAYLG